MEEEKTLHDCIDCEGCICEEYCREQDRLFEEDSGSGLLEED